MTSAPALFALPATRNELPLDYAPGLAGARGRRRRARAHRGQTPELPLRIGGRDVETGRLHPVVGPARPRPPPGPGALGRPGRGRGGDRRRGRGLGGLVADGVGGPGGDLPARVRARAGPVAGAAERGHHAQPLEDRARGRDRRRLRDGRLPAVQRALHARDVRDAAGVAAGHLEPARVPPARGVRARDHAVQLPVPGEPRLRPGDDGQRRALEAGRAGRAVRLGGARDARGGGPAARA